MRTHNSLIALLAWWLTAPCMAQGAGAAQPVDVIAQLIDAAEPGATVVVPPGVYAGHLRIKKGITLDGRGAVTIDGGGEGTVVQLLVPDITFRGFTVRGSGTGISNEPAGIRAEAGPVVIEDNNLHSVLFGIDLRTSPESILRRNHVVGKRFDVGRRGDGIRLWWSHGCIVEGNEVTASRDMVFWYSEGLQIHNNHVTDSRYGLHFMYSHDTVLEANTLEDNSVGIYLMYSNRITLKRNTLVRNRGASGYGLGLKDCDAIVVEENQLMANRVGIYIDNSPSSIDSTGLIKANSIAFNEIGLVATPNTHDNIVTENIFLDNEQQVAVHGNGDLMMNQFSHEGRGNFWSDYAGFDRDGDGIGDLSYEPSSLFESLLAKEPNLRLFVHSPAQQAVEFAGRALPQILPSPRFVDVAPLTQAPAKNADKGRIDWTLALASLCMLGGTGAALWGFASERNSLGRKVCA